MTTRARTAGILGLGVLLGACGTGGGGGFLPPGDAIGADGDEGGVADVPRGDGGSDAAIAADAPDALGPEDAPPGSDLADVSGEDTSEAADARRGADTDEEDGGEDAVDPVPACEDRVELQASGSLDLDARVVSIAGTLTRNDEAFVPEGGSVRFTSPRGATSLPLKADPTARFEGELFAGTYDLDYVPPEPCDPADTPLPCQRVRLEDGLVLSSGGAVDLDVVVVALSGVVRLDGEPIPQGDHGRGAMELSGEDAGPVRFALEGAGEAAWEGEVFADPAYELVYRPDAACSEESPLPCHPHRALSGVAVQGPGALDVDLRVVHLSGVLTLEGGAVSAEDLGALSFSDDLGAATFPLTDEGAYEARLFAGTYDVRYVQGAGCGDGPLPCQDTLAHEPQAFQTDGGINVDRSVVEVGGAVTVDQLQPGGDRGGLAFVPTEDHTEAAVPLEASGPATYDTRLFPGTYDLRYEPPSPCDPEDSDLPCYAHRVREGLSLQAGGALDLDLETIELVGQVTLHGAQMPDAPRGALVWSGGDGALVVPLDDDGAATWEARLFPGTYEVAWAPPAPCPDDAGLACQRRVLDEAKIVTAGGSLDMDLAPIDVSGRLTRDGAALVGPAGALAFELPGGAAVFPVDTDAGGTYEGHVFPGTYDIRYTPPDTCDPDDATLPCQPWLLRGCPAAE